MGLKEIFSSQSRFAKAISLKSDQNGIESEMLAKFRAEGKLVEIRPKWD